MAKKTPKGPPLLRSVPKPAKVETPPELEDDEELELEAELGDAELDAALAELGANADATITVNKVGQRSEERIGRFTPAQFDLDELRDLYGPGTYVIYGRVGNQLMHKKRVTFAQTMSEVKGDRASTLRQQATAAGLSVQGPHGAGGGLDSFTIMRDMYERSAAQQRETMSLVLEAIRGRAAPALDPLEIQRMIFDSAQKLVEIGGGNKGSSGGGIDTLMKGIELGRKFNGSGDGAGISDVAVEFFRSFTPMLTAAAPAAPAAPTPAPAGQAPAATRPADGIARTIQTYTPVFVRAAAANSDPGVYAQLLLDQLPHNASEALVRMLQRDDWWSLMRPYVPQLEPHQAWLSQVRDELLEATAPKGEPEPVLAES